jgi:hypothetical protein
MHDARLSPAILGIALAGCAPKPAAPPSPVGVVEVAHTPSNAERDGILRVLNAAAVAPCYSEALGRDPRAAGDLVVTFTIAADGAVSDVHTDFATLADDAARTCVEDVVRALRFAAPSRPDLRVTYPFLFTSDTTPPEVVRALKLRYGLVQEDFPVPDERDRGAKAPPGVVLVW